MITAQTRTVHVHMYMYMGTQQVQHTDIWYACTTYVLFLIFK